MDRSKNYLIERANKGDAKNLTDLTIRSKAHWNYSKEQIEEWREELTITEEYIEENAVYQLSNNSSLVGFYAFSKLKEGVVKLNFMFIDPVFIGQGFGKIIMANFFERTKKLGFKSAQVDADPNAEKFYSKLGFIVIGKLKSSIKDRYLPIMEKRLVKII